MKEETTQEQSDFEADLRKLVPAMDTLSAEETFYQAGWNAALKAGSLSNKSQTAAGRSIRGFTLGLACGLACATVGMQLWMPTQSSTGDEVVERERPAEGDGASESKKPAVVSSIPPDQSPPSAAAGDLGDVFAMLSPNRWLAAGIPTSEFSVTPSRRGWSSEADIDSLMRERELHAKPIVVSLPENETRDVRQSLRAFPAGGDAFDELL